MTNIQSDFHMPQYGLVNTKSSSALNSLQMQKSSDSQHFWTRFPLNFDMEKNNLHNIFNSYQQLTTFFITNINIIVVIVIIIIVILSSSTTVAIIIKTVSDSLNINKDIKFLA
ncbi:hypothetical protein GQX74_011781 [Glossina fuscipes]|nr:hypothetical protein GQX74_011781 [Glossina fuscipes]